MGLQAQAVKTIAMEWVSWRVDDGRAGVGQVFMETDWFRSDGLVEGLKSFNDKSAQTAKCNAEQCRKTSRSASKVKRKKWVVSWRLE